MPLELPTPSKSLYSYGSAPAIKEPTWRIWARQLRLKQWTKNGIVILPLIFSGQENDPSALLKSFLCVISFCLLSSAIYGFNDLVDRNADREHPLKRLRPIASGAISLGQAMTVMVLLLVAAVAIAFLVRPSLILFVFAFLGLNVLYSLVLKRWAILDVFSIATSFVLRAAAGSAAISVPMSGWFLVCTSLGALFLGFEKRRAELRMLGGKAVQARSVLSQYSVDLLICLQLIVLPCLLTSYIFYAFLCQHGQMMMMTVPFVLYGIMRYVLLSLRSGDDVTTMPEEVLWRDRPIQITLVLWLLVSALVVNGVVSKAATGLVTALDSLRLF